MVLSVFEVTTGVANRRLFFGTHFTFLVLLQFLDHLRTSPLLQSLLLCPQPLFRIGRTACVTGRCQIFAKVIEIQQEPAIRTKDLLRLLLNPTGSVTESVNKTR